MKRYLYEDAEKYHGPVCDYIEEHFSELLPEKYWGCDVQDVAYGMVLKASKALGILNFCTRREGTLVLFGNIPLTGHFMETFLYDDAYEYNERVSDYIEAHFSELLERHGNSDNWEWIAHEMVKDAYETITVGKKMKLKRDEDGDLRLDGINFFENEEINVHMFTEFQCEDSYEKVRDYIEKHGPEMLPDLIEKKEGDRRSIALGLIWEACRALNLG
jgi:hypothetical protein